MRKYIKKYKTRSIGSMLTATLVVLIMIIPNIVQAETTREVDVSELFNNGILEFEFSSYSFVTFNIHNVTNDSFVFVNISGVRDNYPLSLQVGSNSSVNFGRVDSSYQYNFLLLRFKANQSYKLRTQVNDEAKYIFTPFTSNNLTLPDRINLYAYTIFNESNNHHIDFFISNNSAHSAKIKSFSNLQYTLFSNTTYVTNKTITESNFTYLSNITTKLRITQNQESMFHLSLTPCTQLPAVSSTSTYFENETVIIPVSQSTYNQIYNEYLNIPKAPLLYNPSEIVGFSVESSNVQIELADIELLFYESEIYVENNSQRQIIGGGYQVNLSNKQNSTVNFGEMFQMMTHYDVIDADFDGYCHARFHYKEITITKVEDTITITNTSINPVLFTSADIDDNINSVPVTYKDLDSDGIGNEIEIYKYGTDPSLTDTDDDGLGDGFEVSYWNFDSFGGNTAWVEVYYPNLTYQEKVIMFGPLGDIDFDGLTNIIDRDSDQDELFDGMEYNGYHAMIGGSYRYLQTYPYSPDYDIDGLFDGAEAFGYHIIDKFKAQDNYGGQFTKSVTFNNTPDHLIDYDIVLMNENDHIIFNFSTPTVGDYNIMIFQRVYRDDPLINTYNSSRLQSLENITHINLYDSSQQLIYPNRFNGYISNISDNNQSERFSLHETNLLVDIDTNYTLGQDYYHIEINLNSSAESLDIVIIDYIEIYRQGLDPYDSDTDDDGLGDGSFTKIQNTYYNVGENTVGTSPIRNNSDGDSLLDGFETNVSNWSNRFNFTSPHNIDSDGDGLLDGDNVTINMFSESVKHNKFIREGIHYIPGQNGNNIFIGENYLKSNPLKIDTDDDGLLDGKDVRTRYYSHKFYQYIGLNITGTSLVTQMTHSPLILDNSDGSWIIAEDDENNIVGAEQFYLFEFKGEIDAGTSSIDNDTDDDLLPDSYEVRYELNPLVNDSNYDHDNDNLTALNEYNLYIPNGYNGIWWYGTNPKQSDSDLDGLEDYNETLLNSDPLNFDTDGDKLPDGWEYKFNMSFLDNGTHTVVYDNSGKYSFFSNGSFNNGLNGDTDFDGLNNWYEYSDSRPHFWFEEFKYESWVGPQHNVSSLNFVSMGTYWNGLNPNDPDFDNDGLMDGISKVYNTTNNQEAINYLINNSIKYDNTDNNYSFYGEETYYTDQRINDTDNDTFTDGFEAFGFNITINVHRASWDNSTFKIKTNPALNDTDNDGLSDDVELANYIIDAFSNPILTDTDGDGISDAEELLYNTSIKNIDTDSDHIPDNVEYLPWIDIDNDSLPNILDNDANENSLIDGNDATVTFRGNNDTLCTEIAVLLNPSHSNLTKFKYNNSIYNSTNIDYFALTIFDSAILTPWGKGVFIDNSSNIYLIEEFNNETVLNLSKYIKDNTINILNDKSAQKNYSLKYLESYSWKSLMVNDSDYDGIPNSVEGYNQGDGFNFSVVSLAKTLWYQPSYERNHTRYFNYLGREFANPINHVDEGHEEVYVYGYGYKTTSNKFVQTNNTNPDSDGDGLLDGRNIILPKNSSLIISWKKNYNYSFDGELYTFYGEQEPSPKQFWNKHYWEDIPGAYKGRQWDWMITQPDDFDSDNDGLLDGYNLIINLDDELNRYSIFENSSISYYQINQTCRMYYGERSFNTNPNNNNTDGLGSVRYQYYWDTNDSWHEFDSWKTEEVQDESKLPKIVWKPSVVHYYDLIPQNIWDFITDGEEVVNGTDGKITDPTSSDTDDDGFGDSAELDYYNLSTDPTKADTDGDNVTDYREVMGWRIFTFDKSDNGELLQDVKWVTSNPLNNKTDGYQLDGIKYRRGGDPTTSDTDGDGILDQNEDTEKSPNSMFTAEIEPPQINQFSFKIVKNTDSLIDKAMNKLFDRTISKKVIMNLNVSDNTGLGVVEISAKISWYQIFKKTIIFIKNPNNPKLTWEGTITVSLSIGESLITSAFTIQLEVKATDNFDNTNTSVYENRGVLSDFQDFVEALLDYFVEFFTELVNLIANILNTIIDAIVSFVKRILGGAFNFINDKISGYVNGIVTGFGEFFESITWFSNSNYQTASNEELSEKVSNANTKKFGALFSVFGLRDKAEKLMNGLESISKKLEKFQWLCDPLSIIMMVITTVAPDNVVNVVNSVTSYISTGINWLISKIIETIASLIIGKENSLASLLNWDLSGSTSTTSTLGEYEVPSVDCVQNYITALDNSLFNAVNDGLDSIIDDWNTGRGDGLEDIGTIGILLLIVSTFYPLMVILSKGKLHPDKLYSFASAGKKNFGLYTKGLMNEQARMLGVNPEANPTTAKILGFLFLLINFAFMFIGGYVMANFQTLGPDITQLMLGVVAGANLVLWVFGLCALIQANLMNNPWIIAFHLISLIMTFVSFYQLYRTTQGQDPFNVFDFV